MNKQEIIAEAIRISDIKNYRERMAAVELIEDKTDQGMVRMYLSNIMHKRQAESRRRNNRPGGYNQFGRTSIRGER